MAILKGQEAKRLTHDAIVLDMGDLTRQASSILQKARVQADRIMEDARQQAGDIEQQGYEQASQRGHADGYEKGLTEGREAGRLEASEQQRENLERLETTWTKLCGRIEKAYVTIERETRQDAVEFALRVAERVVHRVIEVDPTVCVDQVAEALAHVMQPMHVSIHIHADDRPAMLEALPQIMEQFDQFPRLRLVDDAEVDRGGVVVRYGEGLIDARIETQLKRIADAILPQRVEVLDDSAMVVPLADESEG